MSQEQAKIKFVGIEVLAKAMVPRKMDQLTPPANFHHNVGAASQVNPERRLVLITVDIDIRQQLETTIPDFSITVLCAFEIENFDTVIKKMSDTQYFIPPDIDATLKSVSVSTTRGIIYAEVRGTFLYNAILPIVIFTPEQIRQQQEKEMQQQGITFLSDPILPPQQL